MHSVWIRKRTGFTIVELLIVIVIIGILAAITVVAYNGLQQRARDAQRQSDTKYLAKVLELYYIDNGSYPAPPDDSSCVNEANTARSGCSGWAWLSNELSPYASKLPVDPLNRMGSWNSPSQHTYYYVALPNNSAWPVGCAASASSYQGYYVSYFTEYAPIRNELIGQCANSNPFYSSAAGVKRSNYVVVH